MLKETICVVAALLAVLLPPQKAAIQVVQPRTSSVSYVVMDVESGKVLERNGNVEATSTPGSVLKPLVLITALQSGAIREHDTIACRGTLVVAGHNLACSHPRDITVLDARQALASSCNTYFAEVAKRMPSATLVSGLRSFGLQLANTPRDANERVLLTLGLQGVAVSAVQVAQAYRKLAMELNAAPDGAAKAVREGLQQSVQTGMANAARTRGIALGGKTGTVDDAGGRSHGWFAGLIFNGLDARTATRVIVTYVPNGNGADAATAARALLERGAMR